MDCFCLAILAAAAFKLILNASNLPLHLHNTFVASLVLLQWLSSSCIAQRGLFEAKSKYSSFSLTASTGCAVPLQSAERATEYGRVPEVLA